MVKKLTVADPYHYPGFIVCQWTASYQRLTSLDRVREPERRKNLAKPLHRAAVYTKHREVIAILVRSGADATAPAFGILGQQRLPLHFAALYNENPEVIRLLVAAGADPNAGDRYGQTPLYLAMSWKTKYEPPAAVT